MGTGADNPLRTGLGVIRGLKSFDAEKGRQGKSSPLRRLFQLALFFLGNKDRNANFAFRFIFHAEPLTRAMHICKPVYVLFLC